MGKKVVVLGAGYAGVLTAKKLAKRLKKSDVEITLIDRNPFHTMLTELHEVAAARVDELSVRIELHKVFAGRNVKVVTDSIEQADYEGGQLVGERGTYDFDYLVLASGSKPTFFGVPGAREHSYTLWSYEDAVRLRERIFEVFRQAGSEKDREKQRRLLRFFIVGAGFTGVEMTGELAELAPILCAKYHIDPSLVTIMEGDMLERVVPVLPEKLSLKVKRRLEKMGVTLKLGCGTSGIGPDWVEYKDASGQIVRQEVNTVIWTAGIEGSDIASASAALGQKGRGRIQTDEYLRSEKFPNVYVAGDNLFYIAEGDSAPVPQMVENAEHSADTIARNLASEITGSGEPERYRPKFHGMMVCVGGRWGVANVGLPGKFFSLPSFLAMFAKHFINLLYFVQVLGWNKVYSYMKHEFFTIRHRRSFVGGHFSNRTPSFLLVPLRVFLGLYWVYEGVVKIMEGWLSHPMLTGFFSGANAFYEKLLVPLKAFNVETAPILKTASQAADAVSAATAGGWSGVSVGPIMSRLADPVLMDWKLFGFIRLILVRSGDTAFKIQVTPIDWFINKLVLPNESVQMAFQIGIVIAEILIGLALIGGLFTFLASLGSLALQTLFVTSTGLYMDTWWMAVASLAVLIACGQVFGLDYWVTPVLREWWVKRKFVRKWYLYNDE
jgi:NADH dehydrogenase